MFPGAPPPFPHYSRTLAGFLSFFALFNWLLVVLMFFLTLYRLASPHTSEHSSICPEGVNHFQLAFLSEASRHQGQPQVIMNLKGFPPRWATVGLFFRHAKRSTGGDFLFLR